MRLFNKLRIARNAATIDVLEESPFYRLVRDSLMIVSNINRGASLPPLDVLARQRQWVQGKLVEGAASDPGLTLNQRRTLIEFHVTTLRAHFADRRGAKRRVFATLGH